MSKHARNLLSEMPIDNRASGKGAAEYGKMKGPGKHHEGPMKHGMMHDGPGEYGKMKGPGKHGMHKGPGEYGSMGPKLEMPDMNGKNKKKPEEGKPVDPNLTAIEKDKLLGKKRRGTFLGLKIKRRGF